MDCRQATDMLGGWIDGELDLSQRSELEGHLTECAECQATADGVRIQDADLRRAFAPRRQAAAALATRVNNRMRRSEATPSKRPQWLPLFMATAAGFLLAIAVLRPWRAAKPIEQHVAGGDQPRSPAVVDRELSPPIARLALAIGPVELRAPEAATWMTCPPEADIAQGFCVRTGPTARCELATVDGCAVRLNGDTEVRFTAHKQWDLARGQIWSEIPEAKRRLEVRAASATIVADTGKFDVACAADAAVLTVEEGAATVHGAGGQRKVSAGERIRMVRGAVAEEIDIFDPLLETSWIHELLVLKGPDNPELAARVDRILAQLGKAKLSMLYEDEIRRLGDHCVLPLLRFIQSTASPADDPRRLAAAGIIADVATVQSIPNLIELLADEDPQVRFQAARALERLTGRDQGLPAARWQSDPWTACQPTHKRWQAWWDQNRNRYPSLPPAAKVKSA